MQPKRQRPVMLWAVVASGSLVGGALLALATGRAGAPAGRVPAAAPHVVAANIDARFGAPYNNTSPTPLPPTTDFADAAAWDQRAEFLRHQVLVANGLWPMPEKTPLNAVVHGKMDQEDFTIEKVYFQSQPGHYVTGNLYRPKNIPPGTKVPAVLAPYGHWGTAPNNGRFWWRTDAEIQTEITGGGERDAVAARSPLQETCMNLAHMGCVVFEWDLVGYCDSSVIKHQEGFTDTAAVMRLQSFMGLQTWNGIRAMDFVLSLPEVDPAKVCVAGSSGGATQTMQLGATDARIAATFAIVMVDLHNQGGCICETAPLLRVGTNNVEIATLSAPRPQGDAGASADNSRDFQTNGFPYMQHMYDLLGARANAQAFTVQAGHNHNVHSRELLYAFINKTFHLGLPEPIVEKVIPAIPVAQLSVWDAQHPLPSDFAAAPALRATMTSASEAQMSTLARDVPAYRAMEKVALSAMVDDEMPAAKDVQATPTLATETESPLPKGFWQGTLARRGTGERIPCASIKPDNWNHTIVLWASPQGVDAIADSHGNPIGPARTIVQSGAMVLAIDEFMADNFKRATPLGPAPGTRNGYSAYANGYERTILANRVHDLLSAIAMVRQEPGVTSVRVVGSGDAGVSALLAAGLAGTALDRLAVDLGGFDFDRVENDRDPNLLPGAVKYGGINALATLCANPGEKVLLSSPKDAANLGPLTQTPEITVPATSLTPDQLAAWVLDK